MRLKFKLNRSGQQVMEYLLLSGLVLAVMVAFSGPNGLLRPAINRIIHSSVEELNATPYTPCVGAGCAPICGNGVCESAKGENACNCSDDCGECPAFCGDGECNGTETADTCAYDCGSNCGNGKIDSGEDCDGSVTKSCADFTMDNGNNYTGGTLACTSSCKYDKSGCYGCGNKKIDPGETCDGTTLNATCGDFGMSDGTLICKINCSGYNTSKCCSAWDNGDCGTACGTEICDASETCATRTCPDGQGGTVTEGKCTPDPKCFHCEGTPDEAHAVQCPGAFENLDGVTAVTYVQDASQCSGAKCQMYCQDSALWDEDAKTCYSSVCGDDIKTTNEFCDFPMTNPTDETATHNICHYCNNVAISARSWGSSTQSFTINDADTGDEVTITVEFRSDRAIVTCSKGTPNVTYANSDCCGDCCATCTTTGDVTFDDVATKTGALRDTPDGPKYVIVNMKDPNCGGGFWGASRIYAVCRHRDESGNIIPD